MKTQYFVFEYEDMKQLEKAINNAIDDGCELQGGVCYADGLYVQALTRTTKFINQ